MRWASLVVLATACATGSIPHVPGEPPPMVRDDRAEADYQALLERSTRSYALYDVLDTKLFVRGVWQSPAFVKARIHREALFKDLSGAEEAARLAVEEERLGEGTEIFVAVHANDSHWEDFSRPDTMWRLSLKLGDKSWAPIAVERLGRSTVELRSYYSWMESFWVAYRVRFPPVEVPSGQTLHFHLASALGSADLPFQAD